MASEKEQVAQLLSRAQYLCSRQEKCLSDIRKKLLQWGATPPAMAAIEKRLVDEGYIDEMRFALGFAREKARINGWGPRKIEMALRAKRLSPQHIQQALTEAAHHANPQKLADLLSKKMKITQFKNAYDLKAKLVRFGVARGFDYELVLTEVEKLLASNE